jgi:H(+)-translocating pyrophosphatase
MGADQSQNLETTCYASCEASQLAYGQDSITGCESFTYVTCSEPDVENTCYSTLAPMGDNAKAAADLLNCPYLMSNEPVISPSALELRIVQTSFGIGGCFFGFIFIAIFASFVLKQEPGREDETELRNIAKYVSQGARKFLVTEYTYLIGFVLFMSLIFGILFGVLEVTNLGPAVTFNASNPIDPPTEKLDFLSGLFLVVCIIVGAGLSAIAGWVGMDIATKSNIRTTHACRQGLGTGLSVAFKSGAVMGLSVTCLSLAGLIILYLAFSLENHAWTYLSGFGFGASSIALFARVGGGVYTKAADVGADLVGKYENNIPEDDKRNPAVIADNVGDNVGDVAGMGADLFESYSGSIIAACTLAAVYMDIDASTEPAYANCTQGNFVDVYPDISALGLDLTPARCIYGIPALGRLYNDDRSAFSYAFNYCPNMYSQQAPSVSSGYFDAGYQNEHFYSCSNWGMNGQFAFSLFALPFWIAGVGIISSIIGIYVVQEKDLSKMTEEERKEVEERSDVETLEVLLGKTRDGITVAAIFSLALTLMVTYLLFYGTTGNYEWRMWACMLIGLVAGIFIGLFTEYCTSYSYSPTKSIAESSETGPATVIIRGLGVGMISCAVPTLILVVAILGANACADVYGISIAAVGMLSTLGVTLATDAYGPVADNAGGIAEMAPTVEEVVRERTDALDALGNTTAATGKGFAIGSAVLTSVGLITAYMEEAGLTSAGAAIDLKGPAVISGLLLGAMLPYLFGALTMLSVGQSAEAIISQVRLQFYQATTEYKKDENASDSWWADFSPETWAVHAHEVDNTQPKRDPFDWYAECIEIATASALREMILPGAMAILVPLIVGFMLGSAALGGLLIGALTSGFMLAVMMANAGGAWDNAKKYVEKGQLGEGKGKGTSFHDAVVTGDTVGDPFKDTSGPSLNILIKLMSIMSLVLAPIFYLIYGDETEPFVGGSSGTEEWVGPVVSVIILVILVILSAAVLSSNTKYYKEFNARVEEAMKEASDESGQIEKEEQATATTAEKDEQATATTAEKDEVGKQAGSDEVGIELPTIEKSDYSAGATDENKTEKSDYSAGATDENKTDA